MATVKSVLLNFHIFILVIILTVVPYAGIELPVIDNAEANCKLTVELLSDIHLDKSNPFGTLFLSTGLKNLQKAKTDIDAILVCGDITDDVDEASLIKYYEIIKNHSPAPVITNSGNHDLRARKSSNVTPEAALNYFLKHANNYYGTNYKVPYYTREVNGYKFIILSDIPNNDAALLNGQMEFLDRELAEATANGSPAFVCCHWPVNGKNGQDIILPEGNANINIDLNKVKSIMEKYKNVFYFSGHIHNGIKSNAADSVSGMSNVERENGVTYVSVPSFGSVNLFGYIAQGAGIQMEIYENKIIFRPRNFITNGWFTNAVHTVNLV